MGVRLKLGAPIEPGQPNGEQINSCAWTFRKFVYVHNAQHNTNSTGYLQQLLLLLRRRRRRSERGAEIRQRRVRPAPGHGLLPLLDLCDLP